MTTYVRKQEQQASLHHNNSCRYGLTAAVVVSEPLPSHFPQELGSDGETRSITYHGIDVAVRTYSRRLGIRQITRYFRCREYSAAGEAAAHLRLLNLLLVLKAAFVGILVIFCFIIKFFVCHINQMLYLPLQADHLVFNLPNGRSVEYFFNSHILAFDIYNIVTFGENFKKNSN